MDRFTQMSSIFNFESDPSRILEAPSKSADIPRELVGWTTGISPPFWQQVIIASPAFRFTRLWGKRRRQASDPIFGLRSSVNDSLRDRWLMILVSDSRTETLSHGRTVKRLLMDAWLWKSSWTAAFLRQASKIFAACCLAKWQSDLTSLSSSACPAWSTCFWQSSFLTAARRAGRARDSSTVLFDCNIFTRASVTCGDAFAP
mmetsp:Transcript_46668/g.117576  ORF Transcript_46668/g.117576 Transcript_46668/m.117576 type:complete len:202 (+) Transcript_46668:1343-1948(+)